MDQKEQEKKPENQNDNKRNGLRKTIFSVIAILAIVTITTLFNYSTIKEKEINHTPAQEKQGEMAQQEDKEEIRQQKEGVDKLNGTLLKADGQVEIWDDALEVWSVAKEEEITKKRTQIRTGKESLAKIVFTENKSITLDENTHIVIEKINNNEIIINQIIGRTYNSTKNDDDLNYQIVSDQTVTTVSKANFFLMTEKGEDKKIKISASILEGNTKTRLQKNEESIEKTAKGGEQIIIETNKPVEKAVFKVEAPKNIFSDKLIGWSEKEISQEKNSEVKIIKNDGTNDTENNIEKEKQAKEEQSLPGEDKINLNLFYQPGIGATLYWGVFGETPHGFNILKSNSPNFLYPGSEFVYLPSPTIRSYVWPLNGEEQNDHYFKICAYNGSDSCLFYSDEKLVNKP